MKPSVLILLIIATCLSFAGCGYEDGGEVEVTGWQVLHLQDPSVDAAENSPYWRNVEIPGSFTLPYPPKRDVQYLWLRGSVNLERADQFHGISLGRIYYVDRVYVNGREVGAHLTTAMQDIHFPRNYVIPEGLLKSGTNTVHVYLGIYGREYGGIADRVRLMSADRFLRNAIFQEFIFRQLPIGILILFLGQIIFIALRIIWKDRDMAQIISLIIFVLWISYLMALFSPYYPFGIDFRITLLWSCACIVPIFFFLYIQYYYKVFVTILNMILIPILALFAFICVVNQDTTSPYFIARELGMSGLILSVLMHSYLLFYVSRFRRRDPTILYFIVLGYIPSMAIVWDIINYLYVFHTPPLLHIYTLPAIFVLFTTLKIREATKKEIKLEVLYRKLRDRIGEPDASFQEDMNNVEDDRGGLTPVMEEKLGKVIEFLKENYVSDISREGLASAIGLSPDHMSRKFKIYTGCRLSDYINRLRIEDAARQLVETDKKVIDIAFSVGFESLVTFNRAFLKIKNITPSEFRKRKGNGATVNPQ